MPKTPNTTTGTTDTAPASVVGDLQLEADADTSRAAFRLNAASPASSDDGAGGPTTCGPTAVPLDSTPMMSSNPRAGAVSSPDQGGAGSSEGGETLGDKVGDAVPGRVWNALLANPGATPAVLATAAGAGRSTVSKLLATWARTGSATSAAADTARAARRWTAAPAAARTTPPPEARTEGQQEAGPVSTPPAAAELDVLDGQRPVAARSDADPGRRVPSNGRRVDAPPADEPRAVRRGNAMGSARRGVPGAAASTPASARPAAARAPGSNGTGSARLGAGELRGLVEDFLTEHPGPHSPVTIGHALRRSSGAIANALERLVETGWAERTSNLPKRYQFADADADADADDATVVKDGGGGGDEDGDEA